MCLFKVIESDITELKVDVIVNAANSSLLGGGGVDGAIHRAAGPLLLEECKTLNGCQTGEAKITKGYQLPGRYVIHTIGPIWSQQSPEKSDQLLKSCYENSLKLYIKNELQTIAFSAISTGAYGFPPERAAPLVVKTVLDFCKNHTGLKEITFCCFDPVSKSLHEEALKAFSR